MTRRRQDSTGTADAGGGDGFRKRTFTRTTFLPHLDGLVRSIPRLVDASRADRVDDAFAEKLLLAATAANDCRHCARFHSRLARDRGVSRETVARILERDLDAAVPDDELPALVFAQQYAESDGSPDDAARAALFDAYGAATARDMLAYVRAIHFANLTGNSVDYLLFALDRRATRLGRSAAALLDRVIGALRARCPR
jgi:AhpD family alkylhydroperoxidase